MKKKIYRTCRPLTNDQAIVILLEILDQRDNEIRELKQRIAELEEQDESVQLTPASTQ